ncbi:Arc1p [Sugiyamaella lignohabitans]|uniref:Arc1p n=1 Tax=Sugiyamaella lignohabitans TaxID=796027 RepID=A0A167EB09_9ASCO|nr:Arc1p [Sugiyamaella lignohabitans]ANB13854.1 Arc1p [Sugiyamaella lignohabitans]
MALCLGRTCLKHTFKTSASYSVKYSVFRVNTNQNIRLPDWPLKSSIRTYSTENQPKTPNPSVVQFKTAVVEKVDYHPNADSLYVSQVRVEGGPTSELLTVCSGLVKYVPKDELEGRRIVVVTNLKPSKLRGIKSEAMLLAAVGDDSAGNKKLELVSPPKQAALGETLFFDKYPISQSQQVPLKSIKSKVWQEVQKQLFVNVSHEVIFRDHELGDLVLRNDAGDPATVASLTNGTVS